MGAFELTLVTLQMPVEFALGDELTVEADVALKF